MKRIKKILGIVLAFTMLFALLPVTASADTSNYDSAEIVKLQTFLNAPSSIPGKTNGQVLNNAYDPNEPYTWEGIKWSDSSPTYVYEISWIDEALAGSLDVSGFTHLNLLTCTGNHLSSIDASGTNALRELYCSHNELTSLNVGGCSNLYDLYCPYNQLTDLNLSSNTGLDKIDCSFNQLSVLDLSASSSYTMILCSDNQLSSLDLTGIHELFELNCLNNRLDRVEWETGKVTVSAQGKGYVALRSGYDHELCEIQAVPEPDIKFDGWYNGEIFLTNNKNYTLYVSEMEREYDLTAEFGRSLQKVYTVNFNLAGGTQTGGGNLVQEVMEGGNALEPTATREGYTFAGWDNKLNDISGNITINAIWSPVISHAPTQIPTPAPVKPITYTVTFNLNGGTWTGGSNLVQEVSDHGTAYAPVVEYPGHRFVGWDKALENIDVNTVITAIWEEIIPPPNIVFFDVNGGIRTGGGAALQKIEDGKAAEAPIVIRSGYTFENWDKAFDNVTEDLTVTAIWKENAPAVEEEIYTITYDSNGGTGDVPVDKNEYQAGDIAQLADGSALTKEGYLFAGWSYAPDSELIADSEITVEDNLILYAVWEALPEEDTTVPAITDDSADTDIPKTGSYSDSYLGIMMLLSGAGTAAAGILKRRKNNTSR